MQDKEKDKEGGNIMKKAHFSKVAFTLMLVFVLALAACGGNTDDKSGDNKSNDKKEEEQQIYSIEDFSDTTSNDGEPIDGGTFVYGIVSDTAFQGTLNWNFYSGAPDAEIISWFDESLLTWDENYYYTNDGAATYEVSEDGKTITLKIRDNVNWHDGEPVKAEDVAFSYEVIGHPDYTGQRYGNVRDVVGMEEYHKGEADTISGIEIIDEKTLSITFTDASPSRLTGGIWNYAMPKHIFKDIPVAEMASSPAVRENPIGFGPYKVESIVPGESVTLVKNENYWRGEPQLDKVIVKIVNPNVVVQALKTGEVDTVDSFPVNQYPANADLSNLEFLGKIDRAYSYIGFKLGTWDKEKNEVKTDPNAKMADVNLRRAMWHAIDNDAVGKQFYHGLRWNATTLIPPSHPLFHDDTNPGLEYNPEKAKQILDEAGYKDVDGDGIREDKNGDPLTITFAAMSGDEIAEPLAQYYIQSWKAVGLNVELLDGRLHEFNSFYERVGEKGDDDPNIDVYSAAWGVGIDVDPTGLYGRNARFNFSRWSHEKNDELLAAGVSTEAFDIEKRKEIYKEWQQFMVEQVPVIPTLYRSVLVPVNKRVVNYSIAEGAVKDRYKIGVTQEEPLKAE